MLRSSLCCNHSQTEQRVQAQPLLVPLTVIATKALNFSMESELPGISVIPASLDDVRVKQLPNNAFYISDFISVDEEQFILDKVCGIKHLHHALIDFDR